MAMGIARSLRRLCLASFLFAPVALAGPIVGVQPASLDQPRVYLAVYDSPTGQPRKSAPASADEQAALAQLGLDSIISSEPAFAVRAFLDTGASGIMLSQATAQMLWIEPARIRNTPIEFLDVGVGGLESFDVSRPVFVGIAPFSSTHDGEDESNFVVDPTPVRLKMRQTTGLIDSIAGGIDVAGMPVMAGKVVVIDASKLDQLDLLSTRLVQPGDKSIPKTDTTIDLTPVDFAGFTRIDPPDAEKPTMRKNPMIGPHPFDRADTRRPVTFSHNGRTVNAMILLDTGAASSFISSEIARKLGVVAGPDGFLTGVPREKQFKLPIGGIGGVKTVSGFFADALALPDIAGEDLVYHGAPVLVLDISITDANGKTFTLDGVLGMNFLVASAHVNAAAGGMPDIGNIVAGPFRTIVIDLYHGELRLVRK